MLSLAFLRIYRPASDDSLDERGEGWVGREAPCGLWMERKRFGRVWWRCFGRGRRRFCVGEGATTAGGGGPRRFIGFFRWSCEGEEAALRRARGCRGSGLGWVVDLEGCEAGEACPHCYLCLPRLGWCPGVLPLRCGDNCCCWIGTGCL